MEQLNQNEINKIRLYSEQELQSLAQQQIWKGKGTKISPFVIANANILGQSISIEKSSLYISFINCNFDYLKFEQCENVILENCTFRKLSIIRCKNIAINTAFISDLSFSRVKDVSFKKSIIIEISRNHRIKAILFEDCQINDKFQDLILRKIYIRHSSKVKELVPSYLIIFSAIIFYRLFYTYYVYNSSDIINLILILILVSGILTFLWVPFLFKHLIKLKRHKITIINNKEN
ncbi:MAG: hypothetical protein ACFFEY_07590 [Candidatus Thorarchaeota archaeon]